MSRGGGVAIYAKNDLSIALIKSVSIPNQFEVSALSLILGNNCKVTVVGVYLPHSASKNMLSHLTKLLATFISTEVIS
jgi:hypothetical protein